MVLTTDSQQDNLYLAERYAQTFKSDKFESPVEVHRFYRELRNSEAWNKTFGVQKNLGFVFKDKMPYLAAFYYPTREQREGRWGGHVVLTKHGRRMGVLLHELAHFVTHEVNYHEDHEQHGWQFARIYAKLVWMVMGKVKAEELVHAYVKHNVRYK